MEEILTQKQPFPLNLILGMWDYLMLIFSIQIIPEPRKLTEN